MPTKSELEVTIAELRARVRFLEGELASRPDELPRFPSGEEVTKKNLSGIQGNGQLILFNDGVKGLSAVLVDSEGYFDTQKLASSEEFWSLAGAIRDAKFPQGD